MKKLCLGLLLALFLLGGILKAETTFNQELKYVGGISRGQKYTLGKFPVLIVKGSFRDMGRQYGKLLKEEIRRFYAHLKKELLDKPGFPEEKYARMIELLYQRYPERMRQMLEGMAESSGLSPDKIVLLDNAVLLAQLEEDYFECSALTAWGEYTGGRPLVQARSFDFVPGFKKFNDTLALVVLKPDDGSCPAMIFVNAGQISSVHAFNVRGLCIEANLGQPGDDSKPEEPASTLLNLTQFMLDSGNFATLETLTTSTRVSLPLLFTLADSKQAVCCEADRNAYRVRAAKGSGFLAVTNHFIAPSWGPELLNAYRPPTGSTSLTRFDNLAYWAKKYKGEITPDKMLKLLATPVAQGGVLKEDTITQYVYQPQNQELWVRAPGYQEWVKVPLKDLFGW